MQNRGQLTWKRINKKLKRILKRREMEKQKKEDHSRLSQNPR